MECDGMGQKYDAIIIGAGPSGIFLAYELVQKGKHKNILLLEQGRRVEKRSCPIEKGGKCVKCKPLCNITCGFSGAGAFSDGKLSLYNDEDEDIYVGGYLQEYIGVENTKRLIDYTDQVYLKFGADTHLEGTEHQEEVAKIGHKAKKEGITLINIPIRHLGTEKSHELYRKLEEYLLENGVQIRFDTVVDDLIIKNEKIQGVTVKPAKEAENEEYTDVETIEEPIGLSRCVINTK